MKGLLYLIAGLLIVIWIFAFQPSSAVHLLLLLAGIILLINILFGKRLSTKLLKRKLLKRK